MIEFALTSDAYECLWVVNLPLTSLWARGGSCLLDGLSWPSTRSMVSLALEDREMLAVLLKLVCSRIFRETLEGWVALYEILVQQRLSGSEGLQNEIAAKRLVSRT